MNTSPITRKLAVTRCSWDLRGRVRSHAETLDILGREETARRDVAEIARMISRAGGDTSDGRAGVRRRLVSGRRRGRARGTGEGREGPRFSETSAT